MRDGGGGGGGEEEGASTVGGPLLGTTVFQMLHKLAVFGVLHGGIPVMLQDHALNGSSNPIEFK